MVTTTNIITLPWAQHRWSQALYPMRTDIIIDADQRQTTQIFKSGYSMCLILILCYSLLFILHGAKNHIHTKHFYFSRSIIPVICKQILNLFLYTIRQIKQTDVRASNKNILISSNRRIHFRLWIQTAVYSHVVFSWTSNSKGTF